MKHKAEIELKDFLRLVHLQQSMNVKVLNNSCGEHPIEVKDLKFGLIKTTTLESYSNEFNRILDDIMEKWEHE